MSRFSFSDNVRQTLVCHALIREPLTNVSGKLKFVGHSHGIRASQRDLNNSFGSSS